MATARSFIGDAARAAGVHVETIRYYERIRLIAPPARSGRYRIYGADQVDRLRFIRRARELGFGLAEIRQLLALPVEADDTCRDVRDLAQVLLAATQARIAGLAAIAGQLEAAIRRCDERPEAGCPLVTSLLAG